jgi:hypothetical protein
MKNLLFSIVLLFGTTSLFANEHSEFEVKFKSGTIVPEVTTDFEKAITPQISELHQTYIYRVIQFYSIPTGNEKQKIAEMGIELISYIPNKAFIAKIKTDNSIARLQGLNIRSLFVIENQFKLSPRLTQSELPETAMIGKNIGLNIKYFDKSDKQRIIESITAKKGKVISQFDEINSLTIEYKADDFTELANNPLIQWIEPISGLGTPDGLEAQNTFRSNNLNTNYVGGRKYTGANVVVGLSDVGMIGPHIDQKGRVTQHTVISDGNHSDMTSGIFVGAGNIDPTKAGVAPGAEIHIFKHVPTITMSSHTQIVNGVANLQNYGLVISSTSYSQGTGGVYDASSAFGDQQIFAYPSIMHLMSAGNAGTSDHGYGAGAGWGNISGGYKAGKNVICVGNLNANDVLVGSSSRGPADDGRIKPDLCAQGDGTSTTDKNNTYQNGGGTSAAAPAIAGVFAQLYQAYKENNGGIEPETGLLKAALMNTTNDLGNPGPDFKHGWGQINALKAVRIIEDVRYVRDTISQGSSSTHNIVVPANVSEVRIMTYWTDVEGNPSSSISLVNDIDMQVIEPSSTIHNPWVLDHTPNATNLNTNAAPGIDHLNNVEQVTIQNPTAGTYTVNLSGFAIPVGPQVYYVVYDFIYDNVELTYPIGGEGLVPGETAIVRWDASVSSDMFTLEYSIDGGNTYTTISSNISANSRKQNWSVPNLVSDSVKLKISRTNTFSESLANLTIANVPSNLNILRVCPDTIELGWNAVAGVSMYEVSMLGNKYMDSIGVSNTNSIKITGLNPNDAQWFSVRSLVSQGKGRRAIAIQKVPGTVNCILDNDVKVVKVIAPPEGIYVSCKDLSQSDIVVSIANLGLFPASNVQLNYQLGSGSIITETLAGPIAPGANLDYVFNAKANLGTAGNYGIKVWAIFAGDQNEFNDTVDIVSKIISGSMITTFPYTENFESFLSCATSTDCEATNCVLSNGWNNIENSSGQDDIDWRTNSGSTASTGTGPTIDFDPGNVSGNYLYLESSGACNGKVAQLLSPCIDLSSKIGAQLTFGYHMYGVTQGRLHVDVINDGDTITDVISPIIGDQGNSWETATINLTPYVGDTIIISVRGVTGASGYQSDMAIDGFTFTASTINSVEDLEVTKVTYHPNPSDGNISFEADGLTGDELELEMIDMYGRIVLTRKYSTTGAQFKGQLDLSGMAKGMYIIKLKSGDESRVDRIVLK